MGIDKETENKCCYCWIILIILLLIFDFAKLYTGIEKLDDDARCSIEKKIAYYLILSAKAPWFLYKVCKENKYVLLLLIAYAVFYFILLVLGSAWIYSSVNIFAKELPECSSELDPNTECKHNSCSDAFLKFAWGMVTIDWIYVAAVLLSVCYCSCKGGC